MLTSTERERKHLLFGNGNFMKKISGLYSEKESIEGIGVVERAFRCVDLAIEVETDLLAHTVERSDSSVVKYNYIPSEWIYKDKDNPKSKGMVHPIRVLVEHLNYLIHYKMYLAEYAPHNEENIFYKSDYDGTCGVVDIAISMYKHKLSSVISMHKEYVSLGALPNKG
jgi:hypothetical protein